MPAAPTPPIHHTHEPHPASDPFSIPIPRHAPGHQVDQARPFPQGPSVRRLPPASRHTQLQLQLQLQLLLLLLFLLLLLLLLLRVSILGKKAVRAHSCARTPPTQGKGLAQRQVQRGVAKLTAGRYCRPLKRRETPIATTLAGICSREHLAAVGLRREQRIGAEMYPHPSRPAQRVEPPNPRRVKELNQGGLLSSSLHSSHHSHAAQCTWGAGILRRWPSPLAVRADVILFRRDAVAAATWSLNRVGTLCLRRLWPLPQLQMHSHRMHWRAMHLPAGRHFGTRRPNLTKPV